MNKNRTIFRHENASRFMPTAMATPPSQAGQIDVKVDRPAMPMAMPMAMAMPMPMAMAMPMPMAMAYGYAHATAMPMPWLPPSSA